MAGLLLAPAAQSVRPTNVVLILVDDLGATDLGCCGSRFYRTPNIDRLAGEGMRFTQAYSACTVCSPSRAAILTGKYPARLRVTDWIAGHKRPYAKLRPPDWTMYLPHEEITIAEKLKARGYRTGAIGKWHLCPPGERAPEFYPTTQGFDLNRGGTHRGQPPSYFSPYRIETLADGPAGEYLTDREAREAAAFIDSSRGQPFLLYLPFHTVHTPLQAKPETIAQYGARSRPDAPQRNATYAAMIDSLDENVGRLMRYLEERKIADRTAVIFTSDNGGLIQSTNTNLRLRAGKGSSYEGGVRVPLIVRWPAVSRPGTTCAEPVCGVDLHATVREMAGDAAGQVNDGISLVPLLKGEKRLHRDALYWHYPHYHPGGATPYGAIRARDWKLIEFYESGRTELYNLESDPEEKNDLSAARPAKAKELRARLHTWLDETGAQMPEANPDYDPQRANSPSG
jgi:arylsulfatase A-like enzyme